jgi:spore coat polysaccharide biosynthesis protein SpsF
MLGTLGIVQPQLGTETSKGRVARRFGGKSLLEWVVRRATDCQRLDRVVVLVPSGPEAQFVAELVPPDVPVVVGNTKDRLAGHVAALASYPARGVVRICAEAPFVDPVLIDRLVTTASEHPECDYIGYCRRDGFPTILSSVGMFAEWCRADALRRASDEITLQSDREQVTSYLYSHPEKFAVRLISAPPGLDRDDVRLAIDSEEDWDHAQTIFEALGPESLDWQHIARLLEGQPGMRQQMAVLNRRAAHA